MGDILVNDNETEWYVRTERLYLVLGMTSPFIYILVAFYHEWFTLTNVNDPYDVRSTYTALAAITIPLAVLYFIGVFLMLKNGTLQVSKPTNLSQANKFIGSTLKGLNLKNVDAETTCKWVVDYLAFFLYVSSALMFSMVFFGTYTLLELFVIHMDSSTDAVRIPYTNGTSFKPLTVEQAINYDVVMLMAGGAMAGVVIMAGFVDLSADRLYDVKDKKCCRTGDRWERMAPFLLSIVMHFGVFGCMVGWWYLEYFATLNGAPYDHAGLKALVTFMGFTLVPVFIDYITTVIFSFEDNIISSEARLFWLFAMMMVGSWMLRHSTGIFGNLVVVVDFSRFTYLLVWFSGVSAVTHAFATIAVAVGLKTSFTGKGD